MKFDAHGWLDESTEIDYLNKSMSRQGYGITYLILHGTAGGTSAQAIGAYFRDSNVDASAHIIIDQDGNIVQGIPLSLAAWANGPITGVPANLGFRTAGDGVHRDAWWSTDINPNFVTVSIEHCKAHNDNSDQLTPIQQETSFKVIKTICDTYNIPPRFADATGGITGHFSMDPVNRSRCPGPYPWDSLWTFLGQEQASMGGIPTNWTDDGHTLRGPDGKFPVVLGFRDYILSHQWDPLDYPIEAEHHQDPLEVSHPELGAGQQQLFRFSMLGYRPDRGVFKEYIGVELLALRAQHK